MAISNTIKLIDLVSFIVLSLMLSTGTLLKYALPPRSGGDSILGLTRHTWGDIHFYISLLFLALISMHLFMHIKFIKKAVMGKVEREIKYRLAIGLLGLSMFISLVLAPFFVPVESAGGHSYPSHKQALEQNQ